MRLPETRDLFARKLQFPVTRATVLEIVGDTELHAPGGKNKTIGNIIERCETDEFDSADSLYGTLMTFVGEEFIGRKYYDDRSGVGPSHDEDHEVNF